MPDTELEAAMWKAVHSEHGVAVSTDNVEAMRRKFYAIRKKQPEFQCLSTVVPGQGDPAEVWIVRHPERS